MAASKQPSIAAETSSGEGPDDEQSTRVETKWKRFHPFRVVRKIFRRRVKRQGTTEVQDASKKSWSTSELQCVQDETASKYEVPTPPYKLGLSVSHDSIFSPDNGSNSINPEELNRPQGSSLSVQHAGIKNMFKDELFSRVRARRDSDDDDDIGLPHSPCTSPTTVDVLTQGLKEKSSKSQTTCSAGSLISMGSSENDDDSTGQLSSGHSSRMSLLDRRSVDSEGDVDLCQSVPLNHQAAHHKIAVRPKRTHGLPQRRLKQLAASAISTLPSTPEVTEDNGKSLTKVETLQIIETSSVSLTSTEMTSTTSQFEEVYIKQCDVTASEETSSTSFGRQVFHHKQTLDSETSFSESKMETWSLNQDASPCQNEPESDWEHIKPSRSPQGSYSGLSDTSSDVSTKDKRNSFQRSDEENVASTTETPMQSSHGISLDANVDRMTNDSTSHAESTVRGQTEETEQSLNSDMITLRVSAIVKTLEHSDSSYSSEKVSNMRKSSSIALSRTEIRDSTFVSGSSGFASETANAAECVINKQKEMDETCVESQLICNGKTDSELSIVNKLDTSQPAEICSPIGQNENSSNAATLETSVETVHETVGSLQSERLEETHVYQKRTVEQTTDLLSMRSAFHEEESIMSEKNVLAIDPKLSSTNKDSKIFISHNAAENVSEITEAHNLVTVDNSFVTNVHTLDTVNAVQKAEKSKREEPWVSSVDIGPCVLPSPSSNMTVHSLVSQVANKINVKDKITISVNSAIEESEVNSAAISSVRSTVECDTSSTELKEVKNVSDVSPAVSEKSVNLRPKAKEGMPRKSPSMDRLPQKSVHKRVSVEIVPFSQRMKERKYQPIIYSQDITTEPAKIVPQAVVERKLSDRKSPSDQAAAHVKGNRHSFSGLPTECGKIENFAEDKKIKEDGSYPVHIRIHKETAKSSKSVSEKSTESCFGAEKNEAQHSKTSKKLVKSFVKPSKGTTESEDKSKSHAGGVSGGAPTRWEVKIQPAASSTKSNLSLSFPKDKSEDIAHTLQDSQLEFQDKLSDTNSDVDGFDLTVNLPFTASSSKDLESRGSTPSLTSESPPIKSRENSWRSSKESVKPSDMEPELYRVFARRSIKQKNVEKGRPDDKQENTSGTCSSDDCAPCEAPEKNESNNQIINISNNSTVIKITEKSDTSQEKSPDILKKKSKSFNEKDKQTVKSYSSVQQTSLTRKQQQLTVEAHPVQKDTVHRRQRLASVPDILPPPDIIEPEKSQQNGTCPDEEFSLLNKTENLQRASSLSISTSAGLSNGSSGDPAVDFLKAKENAEAGGKDSPAPSWLQLAQQRRELREQRERLLLGSSTSSFVLESSSKPSRSSKVWDMVNSFQKLQMT